jgi:hypothetical protein
MARRPSTPPEGRRQRCDGNIDDVPEIDDVGGRGRSWERDGRTWAMGCGYWWGLR